MLVSIYTRVSSDRQEKEETIQSQVEAVEKFCQDKGYTIVEKYQDEGWSGARLDRPDLDRLRDDAKRKIWEAVVLYSPDRLARKAWYIRLIEDEFLKLGVKILFVTVPPAESPADRLLQNVMGDFSEFERELILERTRRGRLSKANAGNLVTGAPPYGYDYVSKSKVKLAHYVVNKTEAEVVKKIFNWIGNNGLTTRQVIKCLYDEKIFPRKSQRKVWNSSTLTTLLRNETYIGIAYYNRSNCVVPEHPIKDEKYRKIHKTSRRMRPQSEWIPIINPKIVPAIIDKTLFEKVRRQLKINYEMTSRNRKNEYLLARKIYCTCGCTRAGEGPQKGKHLYYRCTDRVNTYPLPRQCNEKGINARIADKLVWQKISQLMTEPKLLKEQVKRWMNSHKENSNMTMESEGLLKEELKELNKKELRYIKAFGAKVFSLKQLDELTSEIRLRKAVIEKQIVEIQIQKTKISYNIPDTSSIDDYCKQITPKIEGLSFEAKRAILTKVIDKVVGNQKELAVYGYLTLENYKYNQDVEFETSSRSCGTSKCR